MTEKIEKSKKWWEKKRVVHLPLEKEMYDKLKEISQQHDLKVVQLIRKMLKFILNNWK